MHTRDRNALVVAIALGIISGALTIAAAFAAFLVFIAFSFLSPLIVSLMAQNRVTSLSLVSNLIMALTVMIIFAVAMSHSMRARYGLGEILLGILVILLMAVIPALAVSGVVKLIRRKR
ncbi:MAG: hypothetical protein QOH25_2669 [Acidobacteriota bacterium]|jgi:hypothetical protein|nr:hypothetical protein [Acidobacteriota bacterium]